VQACVLQSCDAYWLPTPFSCFPFTSPPVRHRVSSHFDWTLTLVTVDTMQHSRRLRATGWTNGWKDEWMNEWTDLQSTEEDEEDSSESGYELDVGLTFIRVRQNKKSLQIFRPSGCGEHEYRRTGTAVERPSFVVGRWPGFRKPKLTAIRKHKE